MNLNDRNFQNSLRCLQHPATVLSILLLLINDHVLKTVSPSGLTGKLSDFAGLFFFPFIVAAGLSILLGKFEIAPRRLGQLAFGLVAVWFTLLKTSALANSLTAQVASFLVGSPARFVLDITDLVALAVIVPAWKLWDRRRPLVPIRFAYVALAVGAFAAVATSPTAVTVRSVTDLVQTEDGTLYAADRETFDTDTYPVARSLDGGLTWKSDHQKQSLQQLGPKSFPIARCQTELSQLGYRVCYHVTSNYQLEVSYDNEEHWYAVFPSKDISIKARDLLIVKMEGKEYLLVAVGKGGILRRELPDGNWEFIDVDDATSK